MFSRLNYIDNETIMFFVGDLISHEAYGLECDAGRGGYGIQINNSLVLNCYQKYKENKCLASYANSPQGCVVAKANAKLVVNHQNKTARLVAHGDVPAHTEILWCYNIDF